MWSTELGKKLSHLGHNLDLADLDTITVFFLLAEKDVVTNRQHCITQTTVTTSNKRPVLAVNQKEIREADCANKGYLWVWHSSHNFLICCAQLWISSSRFLSSSVRDINCWLNLVSFTFLPLHIDFRRLTKVNNKAHPSLKHWDAEI